MPELRLNFNIPSKIYIYVYKLLLTIN